MSKVFVDRYTTPT